jgi:hypothetical protein
MVTSFTKAKYLIKHKTTQYDPLFHARKTYPLYLIEERRFRELEKGVLRLLYGRKKR